MNTARRLGLYGAGLAAVFAAAFVVAGAVVPEGSAAAWSAAEQADGGTDMPGTDGTHEAGTDGQHGEAGAVPASDTDTVGGYTATLTGDLSARGESVLTATVTKDGAPVTDLQPYLGAYGHLVALREGDLAYLHVHPDGAEPEAGSVSGPDVTFLTEAPTPGRYLLYLDFKVDGDVHTARFVVDTARDTTRDATEGA